MDDELHFSIRPMLAVSHGKHILMSTPFGKQGHFYESWENGGDAWERIKVPASENPRIAKDFLEKERYSMSAWWYAQEYECEFMSSIDSLFNIELIKAAISDDIKPLFEVA